MPRGRIAAVAGRRTRLALAAPVVASLAVLGVAPQASADGPPRSVSASVLGFSPVVPAPSDRTGGGAIGGVSCARPWACVAVGTDRDGRGTRASANEGRGRWRWSATDPLPADSSGAGHYEGVSCPGTALCVAVGQDGRSAGIVSIARRSGPTWRWSEPVRVVPDPSGGTDLTAVSCPTVTRCVAVGTDGSSEAVVTVGSASASSWRWTAAVEVRADASGAGRLSSVSCPSATTCVAVGTDGDHEGIAVTGEATAARWTWSASAPTLPDGAGTGGLASVSCPATGTCAAVGTDGGGQAIVDGGRRTGASWRWTRASVVASDSAGSGSFTAVSCPTTSLCVAAGADGRGRAIYSRSPGPTATRSWSTSSPIASRGTASASVAGLACASSSSCVAVGSDAAGVGVVTTSIAVPGSPRGVRPVHRNGAATVSWHAPAFDGGAAVGHYDVVSRPRSLGCSAVATAAGSASCTVTHLVDGTPYSFEVSAVSGIGVGVPSPWSAPVTPSPYGPPVASPFTAAVSAFLASRSGVVTACVFDLRTGQTWTIDPSSAQHTASIVKVEILAALLYDHQRSGQPLSPATVELATLMIEESDNDAASQLFDEVGQAPGLESFGELVGLTGTTPNYAWGFTSTTSMDQVRLVRLFVVANHVLTDASRRFGLELMLHVDPDQAWGVSSGPPRSVEVALKNGWYPTAPEAWQINSIGWVNGEGRDYAIAVLTKDDATMTYGVETIEGLSSLVWRGLRPARARS